MANTFQRIIKKTLFHEIWDIMVVKSPEPHHFPHNTLDIIKKTNAVKLTKKYAFQADPFIIARNNKLYIFYEAFNFITSRGTLRCRTLNESLAEIDDVKLEGFDDLHCHLSFPFIFYINDKLFMIPESSERREVILFELTEFPARWKKVRTLISGSALTDNVLLSINEKYYLCSTDMADNLVIHTASDLAEPWQQISPELEVCNHHPRGAGAPHYIDNKIYIVTQECLPGEYGKSVYIKALQKLTAQHYEESLVDQLSASVNNSDGIHTLNFSSDVIIYDTKHLAFSLLSPFKKIAYKLITRRRNRRFSSA
ncbi:hypothetical protein [Shimwellia blattae]|nr:Uncharacterised protein [Shimwellia blattae]VEC20742.1 Uncharacterised protein [Shimwellia blattae]